MNNMRILTSLILSLIFILILNFEHTDFNSEIEPAVTIGMTNDLSFTPDTVHIQKGETIVWENSSLLVHSVTADHDKKTKPESVSLPEGAEPFDSGLMDPDETYSYTFTVKGTYTYFCIPHEAAMRAVVIVG